ncbi:hypothetical protein [uncultured Psychroserpens sp.]|uniref:hypothetical protein n=1 Tax=uncultured Psychroserpens sp. TaxID=255436 RepID=UPI0026084207|nr:hypothetical protein [uncultured Psychroserpens sp.]
MSFTESNDGILSSTANEISGVLLFEFTTTFSTLELQETIRIVSNVSNGLIVRGNGYLLYNSLFF